MSKIPASDEVTKLLKKWQNSALQYAEAHLKEANALQRDHRVLGSVSIALSAIVGSAIFASTQKEVKNDLLHAVLGALSIAAAIVAGLQTFYRSLERHQQHRIASAKYGAISSEIDICLTKGLVEKEPAEWLETVTKLSTRLDALAEQSEIPSSMKLKDEHLGHDQDPVRAQRRGFERDLMALELLALLKSRNIIVPDVDQKRIKDAKNVQQLEQWLSKATSASSLDEVLGKST